MVSLTRRAKSEGSRLLRVDSMMNWADEMEDEDLPEAPALLTPAMLLSSSRAALPRGPASPRGGKGKKKEGGGGSSGGVSNERTNSSKVFRQINVA